MKRWVILFLFLMQLQVFGHEQTLCLTMIVKNESAVIKRCLESVLGLIDCISICDTGSTDQTVAIIEKFMAEHHIPGRVYHHEWQNFGFNRTESFKAANDTLRAGGFKLEESYLLLLDADMTLTHEATFQKADLQLDGYHLRQKLGAIEFDNIRLIRASLPWTCVGATHEYWQCEVPSSCGKLTALAIDDCGDGGSKGDKFIRDEKLLVKTLEQNPHDVRAMFYLAQTYQNLREYKNALLWYERRIAYGGWDEEIWFSKFMVGSIHEELGHWEKALSAYLDAYQYRPHRAEPLHRLAKHFRINGKNELAYLFAAHASKIPYPNDKLFIEYPVYAYQIDEELSIAAYYTSFRSDGFLANERLLFQKSSPATLRNQAEKNSYFYADSLKNTQFKPIAFQKPYINEALELTYNALNPSICKIEDGYLVACRCVNYLQIDGQYRMLDPLENFSIHTKNFLLHYDKNFQLLFQKEIIDHCLDAHKIPPFGMIDGIEDIRLFSYREGFWFTGTIMDTTPYHIPQMGLFQLGDITEKAQVYTKHCVPLTGPSPERCEKNWMPFIMDGTLHVIYLYDPFVIYKVDEQTGQCHKTRDAEQKYHFSQFRGSAPPIPFDDGYLMIVHTIVFNGGKRVYLHRFVALDYDYRIKQVSRPFTYVHHGVEYCCGFTTDHTQSRLIMTVGIEDAHAFLVFIDCDSVRQELRQGLKL